MGLAGLLRERYRRQANDSALHIDGAWLSFGELGRLVFTAATALLAAGVRRGDRLGTLVPNSRAFVAAWLAAAEIGATLVPFNSNLSGATLRYIVEHADLHLLLVHASAFET